MAKCRIGTAKFFTLLLLLYRTLANVQEYKNRLKNEKFKAAEIAKATGSEISLMTTTATTR